MGDERAWLVAIKKSEANLSAGSIDRVLIFCDGSLYQKTKQAGVGAIVINRSTGKYKEISKKVKAHSNTEVELAAAVAGLRAISKPALVDLYTDCQYVVSASPPNSRHDRLLWKAMAKLCEIHHVAFFHVPRDRGDIMQLRSHTLAQKGALGEGEQKVKVRIRAS